MRIRDRQKQRREYLKKKTGKYSLLVAGGLVLLPLFFATIVLSIFTFYHLIMTLTRPIYPNWQNFFPLMLFGFLAAVGGYGSWALYHAIVFEKKDVGAIPYIPPVTPNTLPAEEVLVRGAQEPTEEQSTVLLRAAEESADPAEQLLRASVGE